MKKKIIALSLTMWYAFCPLLTTGCNQKENNSEIAKVWSALSTEKYMQSYEEGHTMLEKMGNTEAELDFVGMRGETQSMQLMITANEYIKGYNLTTADLQTQEGVKFDRANIQVYAEHYVEIYAPFVNQSKHGVPYYSDAGYYPDALVPIESYRITREDRVRAGNNQGIWIDVEIPYDTQAGDYSGVFILTLNDDTANPEIIEIPVTLKVYDLEMYEEVHSRTIFNIRYDQLSECLGDDYFDENTNQVYYDYLLSKRLCSGDINPDYTNNLTTFIDYISSDLAENPKVTTYTVPNELIPNFNKDKMCPKTYDPNNPTAEELEYQQKLQDGLETVLRKMLEKNILLRETGNSTIDILKKAMFYYEDEPTTGYRCERVRIFCSKLKLAKDAIVE